MRSSWLGQALDGVGSTGGFCCLGSSCFFLACAFAYCTLHSIWGGGGNIFLPWLFCLGGGVLVEVCP